MNLKHSVAVPLAIALVAGASTIVLAQAVGHQLRSVSGTVQHQRGQSKVSIDPKQLPGLNIGDILTTGDNGRVSVRCASGGAWSMPSQRTWIVGTNCPPIQRQPGEPFR